MWAAPRRGHVGSERRVHWVCILVLKKRSFSKCLCGALRVCGICSEPTVRGCEQRFHGFQNSCPALVGAIWRDEYLNFECTVACCLFSLERKDGVA